MPEALSVTGELIKAAQYLRMSTDHQRYSLGNQAAVIAAYAAASGYEVIRSYVDSGKSGVTATKRDGLQDLLRDVLDHDVPFSVILVLDVSRWGRFQDPDEAAHYEFLCKRAGVQVRYCAEAFENDATGSIMKQLKRVMAGEYSRELSEKVRRGKKRQVENGYASGGTPPYGFVRQVVNADGSPGRRLRPGDLKPRRDQKVRYAWGPADQIANLREIFHLYVRRHMSPTEIAGRLNQSGQPWRDGSPWTAARIWKVLLSPWAIGRQTCNKVKYRLGEHRSDPNPKEAWIERELFAPVVPVEVFKGVERRRDALRRRWRTDAELISGLRRLLARKHRLSEQLITECPHVPNARTYISRFGSMARTYELVGYKSLKKRSIRHSDGRIMTNDDILFGLKRLYDERGAVSYFLIRDDKRLPSVSTVILRLGSLRSAYVLAGIRRPSGQA